MSDQPEALRLIQHMDEEYPEDWDGSAIRDELRRLHEAHDWQYKMAGERLRRVEKLEAERDALRDALECVLMVVTRLPQVPTVAHSKTLRDYFAGQALIGLLACGEAHNEHTSAVTAAASYRVADAMLAAREVKP